MMRAADDFAAIRQRRGELVMIERHGGNCAVRLGLPVSECWCYRAGADNSNLPCPPVGAGDLAATGSQAPIGYAVATAGVLTEDSIDWLLSMLRNQGLIPGSRI